MPPVKILLQHARNQYLKSVELKPTLMILAAGMGSRYGGLKQIDPVGPYGETIMDYSVYDAVRAGFGKLVFVIRREIDGPFREIVGSRFKGRIAVDYAYQELGNVPPGYRAPADRQKPWGTGHAILSGAQAISEPFAVINADDFYGQNSFALLRQHLVSGRDDCAMVGFVLENTLSEFGAVARGVCRCDAGNRLACIQEMTGIERSGSTIRCVDAAGMPTTLDGSATVSLNTWGFSPKIFPLLEREFGGFLSERGSDPKAEFYIPTAVNNLVASGALRCQVLPTPDSWFGVTYREDRPRVIASVQRLIQQKHYPTPLWS